MIFAILIYFVTVIIVIKFKREKVLTFEKFPILNMVKNGIVFLSNSIHRIKIFNSKVLQIENDVYVKFKNQVVKISNVDNVMIFDDYLYFKCLGKVKIFFNCNSIYKYFNISISSKKFTIDDLKQMAIYELINNEFEINFCKTIKKYIKIIKNVLNIHFFQKKLVIKQNKFKLPYVLTYKINNKIKKININ